MIRIFEQIDDLEYFKPCRSGMKPVLINCKCGAKLVVRTDDIDGEEFVLMNECSDHLEDVYGFHCPACDGRYRIKAKNLQLITLFH